MNVFTIDAENNIRALPSAESSVVPCPEAQSVTSQKEFAKLVADWPLTRLVETWNQFAGVVPWNDLKPVKKFTNRDTGVRRIWHAIQKLAPTAEAVIVAAPDANKGPRSTAAADSTAAPKRRKARTVTKSKDKSVRRRHAR